MRTIRRQEGRVKLMAAILTEPRWWRLLQHDGTIIFGIETEYIWSRRKKVKRPMPAIHAREPANSRTEAQRSIPHKEWKEPSRSAA